MQNFVDSKYEYTTLRDYVRIIFRQKIIILTAVITTMVVVMVGLELKPPMYETSVKMLISAEKQVTSPYSKGLMGSRDMEVAFTQSEIVKSNPVIGRVVEALELDKVPFDYEKKFASFIKKHLIIYNARRLEFKLLGFAPKSQEQLRIAIARKKLKNNIKVEPIRNTNLFLIKVKDFTPERVVKIANVISRAYIIFDLEQQIAEVKMKYGEKHLAVKQLNDAIFKVMITLDGRPLDAVEAMGPATVKIVEQASIPLKATGLSRATTLLIASILSVFLGLMLAFFFEYLDQTFKSPQDVENLLGIPVLGSILKKRGEGKGLIRNLVPTNSFAKSYLNLSDQLYLLLKDKKIHNCLFTTAESAKNISPLVVNLGLLLATKFKKRVLIVEANMRKPSLNELLKVTQTPGLAEIIEGKINVGKAVQEFDTEQLNEIMENVNLKDVFTESLPFQKIELAAESHISVLTSGETELNPITLLDSSKMDELIAKFKNKYDVVFFICEDLSGFTDASLIASKVGGVVLVIDESKSRRYVVQSSFALLKKTSANILGVILNNRTYAIPKVIYDNL